jgi:hypothetical protein
MREATVAKSRTSHEMVQAGLSEAERYPLVTPSSRSWAPWVWFFLAWMVAWLVFWIADGPYNRVPAILTGLAMLAFFLWIMWKGRRTAGPEENFVQLAEDEMRIKVYGRSPLKMAYAEIVGVRPATQASVLERSLWVMSKREVPSYLEIELSKARWFLLWTFPWRLKRLFLKPVQPMQFELALRFHLDRFARRQSETGL